MYTLEIILNTIKAASTVTCILLGLGAWLLFSVALLGCSSPTQDPIEQDHALPKICALNDSTVKVFDKAYKIGKTKRATVYVAQDGALWLRWPDGTQKAYDAGQVYGCSNDSLYL